MAGISEIFTKLKENEKKLSKNKLATVIALCLMISMTVSLIALPVVSAHNPPVNVPTFVYVAVAPNPVGLNQAATLVLWSAQAPPDGFVAL